MLGSLLCVTMPTRPRHQTKDFELLLVAAESRGWRITKNKKYFKCMCPCDDKHLHSVVLTPSSQRTLINTKKKFERCDCWEDDQ